MFVHGLVSVLLCVALALRVIVPGLVSRMLSGVRASTGALGFKILCVALLVVYAALGVALLLMALNRGKKREERGFISVDSTDTGRVRIAVSAIEQMVRQSVRSIDGINEMKINIEGQDDAIAIAVNAIVASGSHVPTLTRNMQRSIRQFVEVNCGVSVNDISISIDAVSAQSAGKRQRIWGRGKGDKSVAPVPIETPIQTLTAQTPEDEAQSAGQESEIAGDSPAGISSDQSAYDFDKPYESEFAKDLEALRAKEASEAEADAGDGE